MHVYVVVFGSSSVYANVIYLKLNYGINKESIDNQEQKLFSFNPNL